MALVQPVIEFDPQDFLEHTNDVIKNYLNEDTKQIYLSKLGNGLQRDYWIKSLTQEFYDTFHVPVENVRTFTFTSAESLKRKIKSIPLQHFFRKDVQLNVPFPCMLKEGNEAWIYRNDDDLYFYVSKRKYEKGNRERMFKTFDVIDLVGLRLNIHPDASISYIMNRLGYKYDIKEMLGWEERKYKDNLTFMEKDLSGYVATHNFLTPYLNLFKDFQTIALDKLKKVNPAFHVDPLFFVSASDVAKIHDKYSSSHIARILNLFSLLGWISKVEDEKIPDTLLREAARIKLKIDKPNRIQFYRINSIRDVILDSELKALELEKNKVTLSTLDFHIVEAIFGRHEAEKVYVQETQTVRRKKSRLIPVRKLINNDVVDLIEKSLVEFGMVSKEKIILTTIEQAPHLDPKTIKNTINRYWNIWLNQFGCEQVRPTKELKKRLGLNTNQSIGVLRNK